MLLLKVYGVSAKLLQKTCLRSLHTTIPCQRIQAGRYKKSPKGDKPLTYEMAWPPQSIGHHKSWNSWNTSNLLGGLRASETAIEDEFIRRFVTGTWHNLFLSDVIIKRQHNIIRIAGIVHRSISAQKMYFLIGYTEELLSYWLQCPIKLELQTVDDRKEHKTVLKSILATKDNIPPECLKAYKGLKEYKGI